MKLCKLFSRGAVLQRRQLIPVWGETAPNSIVKASVAGVSAFGVSSSSGDFMLRLPPVETAGGPHVLTVENISNGEKTEIEDVLIGEVWLASGQSNMEFRMGNSPVQLDEFREMANDPATLRMFNVGQCASSAPQKDCLTGKWMYSDKLNSPDFSAVALWFAYKLREKLGVPVGVIHSSWGGTFIESWIGRETLMNNPEVAPLIRGYEQRLATDEFWDTALENLAAPSRFGSNVKGDPGNKGETLGWAKPGFDDSAWIDFDVPGSWTDRKLAGNGSVWIRREIEIPAAWEGKELELRLGGVDKHDVTYFNGVKVGASGQGFDEAFWNVSRFYKVPAELVKAGRAVIAIRAFSFIFDGGFGGRPSSYALVRIDDPEQAVPLAGTWKFSVEADFGKVLLPEVSNLARPNYPNTWSILYDGMIRPLVPYALRGAIWYQGENNAGTRSGAIAYERLMCELISDWRFRWGQGNFPFYMVQLANYRTPYSYNADQHWPTLRESQRHACEKTPNTGMAVIIDCGEELDIHPKDKRSVGYRLARLALHNDYGFEDIVPGGPLPKETVIETGALRVRFENAQGLHFKGEPRGFHLAGDEGEFMPADSVTLDGAGVVLRCAKIARPLHVRYSWSDNPDGNLYNGEELPATPFEA